MMKTSALIDSGFLRTLYDPIHRDYAASLAALELGKVEPIIPYIVLTEAAFLFRRDGGVPAVVRFLTSLQRSQPRLEITQYEDLERAKDMMLEYGDVRLDFVDCCIVAMAERLNITKIATVDRRDFTIIRPKHCEYFELLP